MAGFTNTATNSQGDPLSLLNTNKEPVCSTNAATDQAWDCCICFEVSVDQSRYTLIPWITIDGKSRAMCGWPSLTRLDPGSFEEVGSTRCSAIAISEVISNLKHSRNVQGKEPFRTSKEPPHRKSRGTTGSI